MDTDDYDHKMNTIISDTTFYKTLDFDFTDKYVKSIKKELESLKNNLQITQQFYSKFYPRGCSVPKIYGLPNIIGRECPSVPLYDLFHHHWQN